ncbi:MAG: anti-sigma factor antagonist [Clostridia bacterium]|nr:anti-sigma factor antagonist [Clostridia bacterium]
MTISWSGDIDHHRATVLRTEADELICRRRPRLLRLDLSGIEFMDSSGLGLIMGRYALLERLGGRLIVVKPSKAARRMMTLAAMERFIATED